MVDNFILFLLILTIIILVMRMIFSTTVTILLMVMLLMPIANNIGINSWIVGFSILILGEIWFFPRQYSFYSQVRELAKNADDAIFLKFNMFSNAIKLIALYCSVFYWQLLGLL